MKVVGALAMLGGVSELADRLGISRQRVAELRGRQDFPQPVADLSSGPVWDMADIDRWMASGARRRPGRPSSAERVVGGRFALDTSNSLLGTGGFAEVHRADDRRTGAVVAVKILKNIAALDSEEVVRFRRELRLMQNELDHPHVVPVLAQGDFTDTDEIWYAMPLAVGSLQDEIATMAGDLAAITDLARQICAGVGHVHDRKILHRDLKPGNILRSAEGMWQIGDFGLAREDERKSQALTTTLAQGMGTYFYCSPEQWQQPKYADRRDDIYSIGKILQHAITGQIPVAPADQIPESPLRPVIQRAIGPKHARYTDTDSLLVAIDQAVAAYSASWEEPTDRLARLRPRLTGPTLDAVAADELVQWLLSDDIDAQIDNAARALIAASRATVRYIWSTNPSELRAAYVHVVDWIQLGDFSFAYCDTIADAVRGIAEATGDNAILRGSVSALARLGTAHHRWHVRTVLTDMLQGIRTREQAVVALEGLQDVEPDEVDWSITDFAARSMHPVLRSGITAIKGGA